MEQHKLVPIVEKYTWAVPARLVKIVDADTFDVMAQVPVFISIPFFNMTAEAAWPYKIRVRLEGVAAAEDHTVEGKMATSWTKAWFEQYAGQTLFLHTNNQKDAFGRALGDLRLAPEMLSGLANDLLQSPFGKPYTRELFGSW